MFGALLVPAGRIADRVGRKRIFLLGLGLFSAASALCGVAPSPGMLIAALALQALGAALLLPSSLAHVLHAFPAARGASAMALWGAVGALAAAIGPSLGSLIIQSSLQLQVLNFQKENEYGEVSLVDLGWRGKSASQPRDR